MNNFLLLSYIYETQKKVIKIPITLLDSARKIVVMTKFLRSKKKKFWQVKNSPATSFVENGSFNNLIFYFSDCCRENISIKIIVSWEVKINCNRDAVICEFYHFLFIISIMYVNNCFELTISQYKWKIS